MGGVLETSEESPRPATVVDPFEHEQRFILTRAQAASFYAAVGPRAALELYDRQRPISYTRTTYLDTDDYAYFRSCEGPVAQRLRIREYASARALGEVPVLSGIAFLELKQNAGTTRSKVRLETDPAVLQRLVDGEPLPAELAAPEQSAALAAVQRELADGRMAPRLSTIYRRTCMTGEGGRVRITLDEGLTFCRPHRLGAAGELADAREVIATGPARVLEIKHWGETPEWLARAVADLPPAPRFSKFRVGMLALAQKGLAPTLPPARTATPAQALFILTGNGAG